MKIYVAAAVFANPNPHVNNFRTSSTVKSIIAIGYLRIGGQVLGTTELTGMSCQRSWVFVIKSDLHFRTSNRIGRATRGETLPTRNLGLNKTQGYEIYFLKPVQQGGSRALLAQRKDLIGTCSYLELRWLFGSMTAMRLGSECDWCLAVGFHRSGVVVSREPKRGSGLRPDSNQSSHDRDQPRQQV